MKQHLIPIAVVCLLCIQLASAFPSNPYCLGADISWVQQQEDKGMTFTVQGQKKEVLSILKDKGFNWMRLRLFVNPSAEKGYSKEGYCDLEHTLAVAKRIKSLGLKLLLDFHYSDTWADPGKQFMPSAWEKLKGKELENQVFSYTKEVLKRFEKEGVLPEMVQIGNEINHGMLWPEGKTDSMLLGLSALLRKAGAAVREVDPRIQIMVHIACGGQNKESVWFLDRIIQNEVPFDVIGESYYPEWHGTLADLRFNLTDLIARYHKPVVVVEYQEFRKEVNEIVLELPDSMGLGTFIWEATSPRWGHLFDQDGASTEFLELYPELARRFKSRP